MYAIELLEFPNEIPIAQRSPGFEPLADNEASADIFRIVELALDCEVVWEDFFVDEI